MSDRAVDMRGNRAGFGRAAAVALVAMAGAWAGRADAAVAYVSGFGNTPLANANPNAVNWSSGNISVTPGAGTNRVLVVVVSATEGSNITSFSASATYNGATATQAVVSSANSRNQLWIGYFKEANLPAGAANLAVTVTSDQSFSGVSVFAGTYQGVDQTTPITGSGSVTTTGSQTITLASAVTSNAGGAYVAAVSHSSSQTLSSITPATYTARVTNDTGPNVGSNVEDKLTASASSETTSSTLTASSRQTLAVVSLNPASSTITIGNGSAEPANSSKTSGQVGAIDAFSVQTSSGTATITGVTVNLTAGNTALSNLFINSSSACTGTTYGTLASPASGNNTISLTTNISATTSSGSTNLYVCGTAATVASSTSVTGNVSGVTATGYGYTDSDTNNATLTVLPVITIGNGSAEPASSTIASGQVGAIGAFSLQTSGGTATVTAVSVSLTFSSGSPLTNVFVNSSSACTGTTYGTLTSPVSGNNTINLTTSLGATTTSGTTDLFVCGTAATVTASATVTGTVASVTASGYGATDTDTTSATLTVSPALTIGNGSSEPANSSKTSGQVGAIDAFSVQTSSGTATITAVTATLTFSTGSPLTNVFVNSNSACTGTTYGTLASPVSGSNAIALTTNISATTTSSSTSLYLCGTAATVTTSATVTGTVASVTASGYGSTDNDTTSATLTVTVPPSITIGNGSAEPASSSKSSGQVGAIDAFSVQTSSGTATITSVAVTLTFSTGSPLTNVFVNSSSACTGTTYGTLASPVSGSNTISLTTNISATTTSSSTNLYLCGTAATVSANATVTGTVASVTASGYGFVDNDTTSATLTVTPPPVPGTTTGAINATVNSCTQVTATASYTGDTDGDNTVTFSRSTDGTTFTALAACTNLGGGTNPRACTDGTAAASTSYWYRAQFTDTTGGVAGTNPITTSSSINTGVCAANLVVGDPGIASQPAAGTLTVGATAWTYVGQFTLAATSGTVSLGALAVSNAAAAPLATAGDLQLNLVNATGTGVYATGSWDGAKWVFGTINDPSTGLPVSIGTTAVTFRIYATANYGAAPAENFKMQLAPANVAGLSPATATTGATVTANNYSTAAPAAVNEGSVSSTTGPMVSIVNPDKGKAVSGNFLVQIYVNSANGSAVSAMGLTTDGSTPSCATNDATITKDSHTYSSASAAMYSKVVSGLAAGTHTLKACATNTAATVVSAPVTVTVRAAGSGDGNMLVRDNASQLCSDCHSQGKLQPHDSQSTRSKYGSWSTTCRDCHTPHSTRNLYLVKEQIVPPAVNGYQPARNVYLAKTTGDSNVSGATTPASSSFANSDSSGVCQACHTRTMNASRTYSNGSFTNGSTTVTSGSAVFVSGTTPTGDVGNYVLAPDGRSYQISAVVSATQATLATAYQGPTVSGTASLYVGPPRWRNTGNGDTHYTAAVGTQACTGCHSHQSGFAAGESSGGASCSGCHKSIWNAMNGTTTGLAAKHTLGAAVGTNDSFKDDATVDWGTQTSLANVLATQRSCVNMCHDDHVHDLSPATTHEQNGYADARSATSRAMTRDGSNNVTVGSPAKVDFSYNATTQAWGGMCTSCHQTQVDSSRPAVAAASFSGGGHDGVTTSDGTTTYNWNYTLHDGSSFNRNCTKCHASRAEGTTPTSSATGSGATAVHGTTDPSLLAGSKTPAGTAAGYVCYNCHGSTATPASGVQGNRSKKNIQSEIAKAGSGHRTDSDTVHATVTEASNAAFGNTLGVTERHVNCLDCHDSHQAKAGLRTIGGASGNTIGGALAGTWGAKLSTNPAFWTAGASTNFTKATLTTGTPGAAQDNLEATLCFKCHSSFYGTLPTAPSSVGLPSPIAAGGFTETDTAMEFNPANAGNWKTSGTANTYDGGETAGSFHPVLADSSNNLGQITLTNLVTTNFAWSTTTRNRMRCSDCHASDTNTDPAGPHGSAAKFVLRGPNTAWNASLNSVATTGIFCWNCHSINSTNSRYSAHGTHNGKAACFTCHSAIPHGSMRPGLLSAGNGGCGVNGGTTCGQTSMNINVGGPVVACQNGNGAGTNCLATDNPPYNQAPSTYNKLRLAYYPSNATTNWGTTTAYCGCGNVIGGQGH
ncbi:beta strand repeat-containing protein [Anaeromyxobacter oryzisoli]|uniref:beta strand repeat-containing protein n=1 Tax=Anaeromyxobacter oryzisoli TaxID=2925408 RepID=UPI001F57ED5F|nr:NapC/NirT family cytochrome c [Anaeromyxobacter sp. SG63]